MARTPSPTPGQDPLDAVHAHTAGLHPLPDSEIRTRAVQIGLSLAPADRVWSLLKIAAGYSPADRLGLQELADAIASRRTRWESEELERFVDVCTTIADQLVGLVQTLYAGTGIAHELTRAHTGTLLALSWSYSVQGHLGPALSALDRAQRLDSRVMEQPLAVLLLQLTVRPL